MVYKPPEPRKSERHYRIVSVTPPRPLNVSLTLLLGLTLLLCIVRLWVVPLPSSFWVDEMGTAFVVHHGASDASLRPAPQVADSVYYLLPKLAARVAGSNEISYRLFSLFAMAGTLIAVGAIARRLIHPIAGWFAVFACLAFRDFNYEAADARPYALGSCVLACALLRLIRWLDSGRMRDAFLFALAASLLWWVHLVFWPFYILFFVYAVFRRRTSDTTVSWRNLISVFAFVAAATLPVAIRALALAHNAGDHVILPAPTFNDLLGELKLSLIAEAFCAVFLIARYFAWKPSQTPASSASILLIAGWWLIDPLMLYAFSLITGQSLFVPRYMYLAIPGAVLTGVLCVSTLVRAEHWKKLALGVGVAVLLLGGHWNHLWPAHDKTDWKAAAIALRGWTAGQDVPVICPSPFIEARPPEWRPDYPLSGFLYAHVAYYPTGGHVYPFPYESSPQAEGYARLLSRETLSRAQRFAVYGSDQSVRFWRAWLSARPELDSWSNRILGSFGGVQIAVFTRP